MRFGAFFNESEYMRKFLIRAEIFSFEMLASRDLISTNGSFLYVVIVWVSCVVESGEV